jgi:hypothetical protein
MPFQCVFSILFAGFKSDFEGYKTFCHIKRCVNEEMVLSHTDINGLLQPSSNLNVSIW